MLKLPKMMLIPIATALLSMTAGAALAGSLGSKFNPSQYIKAKQAHELVNVRMMGRNHNSGNPIQIGEQGVVCKLQRKQVESCSGLSCQPTQVPVENHGTDVSEPLIYDTTKLTKEVIKSIKENCVAVEENEPYFKPIFELGISEPTIDAPNKREMVPKLGFRATF